MLLGPLLTSRTLLTREKDSGIAAQCVTNHPEPHVITQSIGVVDPVPDTVSGNYLVGDSFLLCSDDLNDELANEVILAMLCCVDNCEVVTEKLLKNCA